LKSLFYNFFKGNKRTIKAKKNIIASLFVKGISIVIGFLLIRITLKYLDKTEYGIWLTLTSFLTWFTFFEIGLGNGLKNKLAEALAQKKYELAKIYVSTTYGILSIIIFTISILFFIANFFIDWTIVLNTDAKYFDELKNLSFIVFGFFFLRFVLQLIGIILTADQRPALANTFGPLGNLITLIIVFILTQTTDGSLILLGWVLSAIPVIVLISVSIYFYRSDYYKIAPSYKFVNFTYAKSLFNLGFKFFIIQISTLVMFQSSNIIIAQFYGPTEVTPYNIAYKFFGVLSMLFAIVVSPFWSAYTEAWVIKDISWIKKTVKSLFMVWLAVVLIGFLLFFISNPFFDFWIGKEEMSTMVISNKLKVALIMYFLLFTFGNIFTMFINGVGKIKVQMYSLLLGAILFIPISFFLIKYLHWGIESVVIASIVSNFYSPFIAPIQYYKVINNNANGIWNK
jgi:O-antigen/teichoic acid export membrane protein